MGFKIVAQMLNPYGFVVINGTTSKLSGKCFDSKDLQLYSKKN
jgi:hypothetical protein